MEQILRQLRIATGFVAYQFFQLVRMAPVASVAENTSNGVPNHFCFAECLHNNPAWKPGWNKICCTCCTNRIVVAHKMGHMITHVWKDRYFHDSVSKLTFGLNDTSTIHNFTRFEIWQISALKRQVAPWTRYYREVLVVRDIYATIVSGYLYHKSGRECWLNYLGKKFRWRKCGQLTEIRWRRYKEHLAIERENEILQRLAVTSNESSNEIWNDIQSFDCLCPFLNPNSGNPKERITMGIYMDYAYETWYEPLTSYYRAVQALNFTRVVKFEDYFADPYRVFRHAVHDTFSGADAPKRIGRILPIVNGSSYDVFLRNALLNTVGMEHDASTGHSANQDDETRHQLLTLSWRLDVEVFGRRYERINQMFNY